MMRQKAMMAHKIRDSAVFLVKMDLNSVEALLGNLSKLTNYILKAQHLKLNLKIAIKISQCLMMRI